MLDKEGLKEKQHGLTRFSIRRTKLKENYLRLSCRELLPSRYSGETCDPSPARSYLTVTWRWRDQSRVADLYFPWWGWGCFSGASLLCYYLSMCSSILSVTLLWLWIAALLTTVSIATVCSIFIVSANKIVPISYAKVIREHRSQPAAGIEGSGMFIVCLLLTDSW